jgi:hypothetical protein
VLRATHEQLQRLGAKIEDLFYAEANPIAHHRQGLRRTTAEERDPGHEFFRFLPQEEYDLAISSNGADRVEAGSMREKLAVAGFKLN